MTVEELILELKKLPQSLEVQYAAHDNNAWMAGGETASVDHIIKADHVNDSFEDERMFFDMPDEYIVIHG